MPSIKDFEKNNKTHAHTHDAEKPKAKKSRRRPGRDPGADETLPLEAAAEESVVLEEAVADAHEENEPLFTSEPISEENASFQGDEESRRKIHLDFYGSELLRARAPKVFEVAEAVAEEWVNDGRFEGLPVGHPVAQLAAQVGLRKAKNIEKKLEEKGVFMMARMGLEFAKSKLNRK